MRTMEMIWQNGLRVFDQILLFCTLGTTASKKGIASWNQAPGRLDMEDRLVTGAIVTHVPFCSCSWSDGFIMSHLRNWKRKEKSNRPVGQQVPSDKERCPWEQ